MTSFDTLDLDQLRALAAHIRATTDQIRRQTLLLQYHDAATQYVRGLMAASQQHVTPEILAAIDALYDVSGAPTRLASAIGYTRWELQDALARHIDVPCRRCGATFTVTETRKIGGYTPAINDGVMDYRTRTMVYKCKRCRTIEWQNERAARETHAARALEKQTALERGDIAIARSPNPLQLDFYRARLLEYLEGWREGQWSRMTPSHMLSPVPGGCMVCGSDACHVWVTVRSTMEASSRFVELVHLLSDDDNYPRDQHSEPRFGPLMTYHQVLWRLGPANYFSHVFELPLLEQPLLCLCLRCGSAIAGTSHVCVNPPSDGRPRATAV